MAPRAKGFRLITVLIILQGKFPGYNLHFTDGKIGAQKRVTNMPTVGTTIQWQDYALSQSL